MLSDMAFLGRTGEWFLYDKESSSRFRKSSRREMLLSLFLRWPARVSGITYVNTGRLKSDDRQDRGTQTWYIFGLYKAADMVEDRETHEVKRLGKLRLLELWIRMNGIVSTF